jgi:hypothetical protein
MTEFKMLNRCLDYLNRSGESNSIGVTLIMGGTTISGDLIHPIAYNKAIMALLPRESEPSEDDIKRLKTSETTLKGSNEIFLKNAIVISPLPQTTIDQPIAIRIDAIEGFIFGKTVLSIKTPEYPLGEL